MNASPLPCDFDMEIAATLARFINAGFGSVTIEATADYLLADAGFSALLRVSDEEQAKRMSRWMVAA
jgi:hypothetical protein